MYKMDDKPKRSKGTKRQVKHGDYAACVRGVHKHRGKDKVSAVKICNKSMKKGKYAK